jgi:DNA helicase-2/ATP-dependent DNA helicase PcrA
MPLIDEQRNIVETCGQPMLVLAGPGTGKTEVLAQKILYLLRNELATKKEIVGIAFTTKAARSMQDRLEGLGLPRHEQPLICTLHSLSTRILRDQGNEIQIPDEFLIADDLESKLILRDAIVDINPQAINNLNRWRHKICLLKAEKKNSRDISNGLFKEIYVRYQELLRFHSALDFEDLIIETHKLLETNKKSLNKYQSKIKHLLIDEFQDINNAEYSLIKLLSGNANGLFVVGDDKQSIYGWRGGNPRIILNFCNDFPQAIMKTMIKCFRCPDKIIRGADEFIGRRPPLQPQEHNSDPIWILDCKSDVQEAKFISSWIESLLKNGEYSPKDLAILYRGGDVADKVAESFVKVNIPFIRPSPEETGHVRELIACLRLIIDRRDSLALRVCLASPLARGIGDKAIKKMREFAENNRCSFWDALTIVRTESSFRRWNRSLQSFSQVFEDLSSAASKDQISDLLIKIANCLSCQNERRIAEIIEMSECIPEDWSLHDFVQDIRGLKGEKAADPKESAEEENNAVLFITTHSVKGLERKIIFVLGMEKGRFPQQDGDMHEQRRLFYVAMTRAKEKLFLCYAKKREGRSAQGFRFYDKSPFLFEIPEKYRSFVMPNM